MDRTPIGRLSPAHRTALQPFVVDYLTASRAAAAAEQRLLRAGLLAVGGDTTKELDWETFEIYEAPPKEGS